ncbi:MAG: hypothetical protein ACYSOF_10970 [Planctomycetota bacterium]|jgi:hypothetical protein
MAYCIFSKDRNLAQNLNIAGWQSLRGLAYMFGWKPQGTVLMSWKDNQTGEMFPPVCFDNKKCIDGQWEQDDSWTGSYSSNDCQEITADDARNFANALEKALAYIAGDSASETGFIEQLDKEDRDEGRWITAKGIVNAWSGLDAQERIKDFVEMFKAGACHIV